jgi:hypothetical protein
MARWRWLLSAALAASAISSVATVQAEVGDDNGVPVSIDEIPAPARDAIMRHVGTGTLMKVQEATGQGGEPIYGGRIYFGTSKLIIWVDAAGNILAQHRIA